MQCKNCQNIHRNLSFTALVTVKICSINVRKIYYSQLKGKNENQQELLFTIFTHMNTVVDLMA